MSGFVVSLAAETLRMSVPYAMAALGGVVCERSGIVNIALEGILLASGFGAVAVALTTHSPVLGVFGGLATGAALGFLHALVTARFRVDAIVSGIALNLAAAGGTRFLMHGMFGSSSSSPTIPDVLARSDSALVRTLTDPLFLAAVAAVVAVRAVLFRTRFGLFLRASGEEPNAARTVGVPVVRTRLIAVTLGGTLCALGGVALAYDQHQFQSGMSGGRGFIALAAVILSRWRPTFAVLACLAFAALDALTAILQNATHIPPDLLSAIPYVATLASLALVRGQSAGAPAGLGKHAD